MSRRRSRASLSSPRPMMIPLLIDQKHPRGLQDTVFHLVVGRDLGVPKVEYPGGGALIFIRSESHLPQFSLSQPV